MKLGEIADVRMGYSFRSRLEHDPAGNVSVIQMKDVDDSGRVHVEDAIRVSLPKGKGRHLIQKGDLVFRSRGRSNTVALVAASAGNTVLAAPMLLIRPRTVLPAYLQWFINSHSTQATLTSIAEGTSVRMISKEALTELDIPVPSMDRQRRIVQIAALAQEEQKLMADISAKRQRLLETILMQDLRHQQEATR